MKCKKALRLLIILSFIISFATLQSFAFELINIETYDGYNITGKLSLPEGKKEVPAVVIYVSGTGPSTYDMNRKIRDIEFNYFDLFIEQLNTKGIGFFSYNTRGTTLGDNPPYYDNVDRDVFKTHIPTNHVRDVEKIVKRLREIEVLKSAKIILLGWSEGTVISAMVAERNKVKLDAIFLAGYQNETIPHIVEWQLKGETSMIFYRHHFDVNQDGVISKSEYDNGFEQIKKQVLQGAKFEQIDQTKDNLLTKEDFRILLRNRYQQVMSALDSGDVDWIWNNYFRISMEWYNDHAQLKANKIRLPKLDLPIYIFHGTIDQNVPVEGVYDVKRRFDKAGKDNLKIFIFEGHNHDLNYLSYPFQGIISEGFSTLFGEIEKFVHDL